VFVGEKVLWGLNNTRERNKGRVRRGINISASV
jgi:hypothetical protein